MGRISRGFTGRRRASVDPARVPPGQYVTDDFPVLSAGPTPHRPLESWSFEIRGAIDAPVSWTWDELRALPTETVTRDIHCVTKWTKRDTMGTGVPVDELLQNVEASEHAALAFCDRGYPPHQPLQYVTVAQAG